MFLIETITVIPSRIARKLVNNWLFRSKISRNTSVRNRMVSVSLLFTSWDRNRQGRNRLRRMDSIARRQAWPTSTSLLASLPNLPIMAPGGAKNTVIGADFELTSSSLRNVASLASRAFTRTISVAAPYFWSALNSSTPLGMVDLILRDWPGPRCRRRPACGSEEPSGSVPCKG